MRAGWTLNGHGFLREDITSHYQSDNDVRTLCSQSGHHLENEAGTLYDCFWYRHRLPNHVPGELQHFNQCYDAIWQLQNSRLRKRNEWVVRYSVYYTNSESTEPRQHTLNGNHQSCSEQRFEEPNWPNHTQTGKTPSSRIQPISAWRTNGNNACQRNETLRIRYGVHTPRTSYDTSMVTDNGVCTLCKLSGHAKTSITLQPQ